VPVFIWIVIIGLIFGGIAYGVSRLLEKPEVRASYGGGARGRDYSPAFKRMGWGGCALGVLAVVVLALVGSIIGRGWAKGELLSYNEFWNGYEAEAIWTTQPCERDGDCRHVYDCDPYTVTKTRTVTDSKGNSRTETYTETEYHSCPYATEEWSFSVKTSLKTSYDLGSNRFPDNPQPYRGDVGVIGGVPRGIPPFWAEAKARIDSGNPGPVTEKREYDNYILASQNTILKEFSDDMDAFDGAGQIPKIATSTDRAGIREPYLGSKAYFVAGVPNQDQWTESVNRFNSALGTELQGDLHLVFVPSDVDKHSYKGALNAAWTSERFGKDALSKNGLVLIVGVNGDRGEWVRAFTGMPLGNEGLIAELEGLDDLDLNDPSKILGSPRGVINEERKVKEAVHTDGVIEKVVWGANKFVRVCMTCAGPEDAGSGFVYLDAQIEPTGGQVAAVVSLVSLLTAMVWAGIVIGQISSPNLGSYRKES
jgi:hypothetical protein